MSKDAHRTDQRGSAAKAPWPDDKPYKQSPSGMTPRRWRELLKRYVAGEPIRALAAEHRVSVSTIYKQARKAGMRKRDVGVPTLPKGPPPLIVEVMEDGRVRLACGREGFVLDAVNPERSVATLLAQADDRARLDDLPEVTRRLRMVEMVRRVLMGWRGGRPRAGAAGGDDARGDDVPAAPIELRDSQQPPDGPWSTWLFLGGRGAGKTLAGASWLADQAEALGPGGRLALIGPTLHDVREVMIEGVSGVRSLPRWTRATRPKFQASRRRLVFANGCQAYAFSAEDPDSLRGPQFSAAWADEFCAWRGSGPRGAAENLALLRMGLRLPLAPSTAFGGPPPPEGEECEPGAASFLPQRGRGTLRSRVEGTPTHPRLVVTTTPRPTRALVRLRDEASCALTHAPTADNAAHLSPGFLDNLHALYGGTRRAAQELEGRIVELDGALFTAEMMARARAQIPSPDGRGLERTAAQPSSLRDPKGSAEPERVRVDRPDAASPPPPADPHPTGLRPATFSHREKDAVVYDPASSSPKGDRPYDKVIVAIDPAATARGDACGLIAAARYRRADGVRCAVILADRSIAGLGPDAWARRAVALAAEFGATAVVAEVNQGGDMVKAVLKTAGATLKIREVHATRGKYVRAEPVAALYEQGRIRHAGPFDALEEELMAFGGEMEAAGSLDRADALVWAVTDLLVDAPEGERGPRVRWV